MSDPDDRVRELTAAARKCLALLWMHHYYTVRLPEQQRQTSAKKQETKLQ